jgi:hypothetical protein
MIPEWPSGALIFFTDDRKSPSATNRPKTITNSNVGYCFSIKKRKEKKRKGEEKERGKSEWKGSGRAYPILAFYLFMYKTEQNRTEQNKTKQNNII